MPAGAPPLAAVASAVNVPTTIIAAASTTPATPSRRCVATRRLATSPVCRTNSRTHAVKIAPWRCTSVVNGPPLTVVWGPVSKNRR